MEVFDLVGGDCYQPVFGFQKSIGTGAKNIPEAASHEVGHNFSVNDEGRAQRAGYYQGHPQWAPIMGVGYYQPVSEWARASTRMRTTSC